MALSKFTPLFEFPVSCKREIDQTSTRVEGDKTVTETVKVSASVSIPCCLKTPSRAEREEADLERSVWETHYLMKGVLPQAILLRQYANHGGILNDFDVAKYRQLQTDFFLAESELKRLQIVASEDKAPLEAAALKFVTLRDELVEFQKSQDVFFLNTAEAKARLKLIEWVLVHLAYYKPLNAAGEPGDWTPFFSGKTTGDKLDQLDEYTTTRNELWMKAKSMLEFMATSWVMGGDSIDKAELEAYALSAVL